jgi:predicted RNA-binding Zn-ribbon protein involved in translation (DUF1610 family)
LAQCRSLSKIASGELTLDAFMDWQVEWLGKLIETIKSQEISIESNIQTVECPECGKDMFLRQGKKGKFWGCSVHKANHNKPYPHSCLVSRSLSASNHLVVNQY